MSPKKVETEEKRTVAVTSMLTPKEADAVFEVCKIRSVRENKVTTSDLIRALLLNEPEIKRALKALKSG